LIDEGICVLALYIRNPLSYCTNIREELKFKFDMDFLGQHFWKKKSRTRKQKKKKRKKE